MEIELRIVMPNGVKEPTKEPTGNKPPEANTASTPPEHDILGGCHFRLVSRICG